MLCRRAAFSLLAILLIALPAASQDGHLWVGPNVNMVSGTEFPTGDPFQQRQNEPSEAVSTRNVMHVMGFANDYRAVDIPFLIDPKATGDAWLGVFKSLDGGLTWQSTLLPGYPQDPDETPPLWGYQAGADPVVRAGTHGLFYLSGIVFDRGVSARSAVFVSRYMDLNNLEGGDPIEALGTTIVEANDPGEAFIDKPWMAVDIPRNDTEYQLEVWQDGVPVNQTVTCGNVYLAWAEISGVAPDHRSTIMFTRSTDCGQNWDPPQPLSEVDTLNQGVTIAVSPNDGSVWVAWRQFNTTPPCFYPHDAGFWKDHPEEWPDLPYPVELGQREYANEDELIGLLNTEPKGGDARYILTHQLIPAMLNAANWESGPGLQNAIDAATVWLHENHFDGRKPKGADKDEGLALKGVLEAYNTHQDLAEGCTGVGGRQDAIMVTRSIDAGASFLFPPTEVSPLDHFAQGTTEISFRTNSYPTMTVDNAQPENRAYLAWATRGLAIPRGDAVEGDARIVVSTSTDAITWTTPSPIDQPEVEGHQIKPTIVFGGGEIVLAYYDLREDFSGVFEQYIADWPYLPLYRHTVDVRAAHASPDDYPVFTDYTPVNLPPEHPSDQVSRYAFTTNEPSVPGEPELPLDLEQLQFNPPNLPIFVGGTMPFFGDYIDIAISPPFLPDGEEEFGWRYNIFPEDGAVFHAAWTDNRDVEAPFDGDWTNWVPPQTQYSGGLSHINPGEIVPDCQAIPDGDRRTRIRNQNTYTARMSDGLFASIPGGARPLGDFQRAFVVFVRNDSYEDKTFWLTFGDLPEGVDASFDQFEQVSSLKVEIARYSSIARTVFVSSPEAPDAVIQVDVTEDVYGGAVPLMTSVFINADPSSPEPADDALLDAENYNLSLMNRSVTNLSLMNLSLMNDPILLSLMNLSLMNPALVSLSLMNLSLMNLSLMNLSLMNPSPENLSLMNLSLMNSAIYSLSLMNAALMIPDVTNLSLMNLSLMNESLMNLSLMNGAIEEVTWRVNNTGTATAGYSFNLLAEDPPEQGFEFQLFVYQVYTTPVADGCELKEEMQHQMLVSVLDPEILDLTNDEELARFLDPETDDWGLDNVTVAVPPGGEVFVTAWIIDLFPPNSPIDDGIDFSHEDLGAAAVAHAVNTDEVGSGSGSGGEDQQPFDSDFVFGSQQIVDPLVIDSVVLPDAAVGEAYSYTLTATGGLGPRTWSFEPGSSVPAGLLLDANGNLSWTPTAAGTYDFTVRVVDETQQATTVLSITVNDVPMIPLSQRNALIALYNSTDGDSWTNNANWKTAGVFSPRGTECTWFGIQCGSPYVERIDLQANNLVGTIPPEIGDLANLDRLDLGENQLTGSLPTEFGNLAHLRTLILNFNELSGEIPTELGDLPSIEQIYLGTNQLTGSVPASFSNLTTLSLLHLGENHLSGIPPEIGAISNLRFLYLYSNQFAGAIPAELGDLSNLIRLNLGNNQFVGAIPPELGNLGSLQWLHLHLNQLDGPIPPELANLNNLQRLALYNNQLTGAIPPELGNLLNLQYCHLGRNNFVDSIPPELGSLTNLQFLYLDQNNLTGAIPPQLGDLGNLQYLILNDNQLDGPIPAELGDLDSLRQMSLFSNQLDGSIPPEFGTLVDLANLYIYDNQLTGSIPPQLGNLANLKGLALQRNQLSGAIPPELGNLGNLQTLLLRGNQLVGPLPLELATLTNIGIGALDIRWNALYSTDPSLTAFLDSRQIDGDWQSTQTVAPTGLVAGSATSESVILSWDPITYTGDTGGYEILYSSTPGGPYVTYGARTVDKSVSSVVVSGLNPTTPYVFVVRTVTDPHAENQNTVMSGLTSEESATTLNPLEITTSSLPYSVVGSVYAPYTLTATGGAGPYTWSLAPSSGPLPDGLELSASGIITGTPTAAGNLDFRVRVTDGTQSGEKTLNIQVIPSGGGLVFLTQPADSTAGQVIPDFSVLVLDGTGSFLPGYTVSLSIGNAACPGALLSPPPLLAIADSSGVATFSGFSIDRGGYGYTLEASTTIAGPVVAESEPFGLEGFCATGSLGTARIGATMTRLHDGRALVVGGVTVADNVTPPLNSAEIFDPTTGTWTSAGNLNAARSLHTATLLADGRVLITGGSASALPATGPALNSAEIFDPADGGSFTTIGPLTARRLGHTATALSDGRVLIAGGRTDAAAMIYLNTAEIFDPAGGGSFVAVIDLMNSQRDNHRATRLSDGRVLLVGGLSAPTTYLSSAEIFDLAGLGGTGEFTTTGSMAVSRINHTATLLNDGRVLVAGGNSGSGALTACEVFDPTIGIGTFVTTDSMSPARENHEAVLLSNGKVLVSGGGSGLQFPTVVWGSAELFDPTASGGTGSFADTNRMISRRFFHLISALPDGRALIAGGVAPTGAGLATAEVFWPIGGEILWTRQFGSEEDDQDVDISVGSEGVYVTGGTEAFLPGQTSSGEDDVFLRKYDIVGNELWTRQFGTIEREYDLNVVVDGTAVYVSGHTENALPGCTNAGGRDVFVRKYGFGGSEVWTRQFGTAESESSRTIAVDASGFYVAGGTTGSFPGFTNLGSFDVFVRKFGFDGTEIWTLQFGSAGSDYVSEISVSGSGVYISGGTPGSLPGETDAFVRKYDFDGTEIWTHQFGTADRDYASGISADTSGVYVVGRTASTLPGQTSAGSYDAFIRKYDIDGAEIWTRQFGTAEFDQVTGVSVDGSGVYVAGRTRGAFPGQTNAGSDDAFVRKYSFDGTEIWTHQFGSSGREMDEVVSVGTSGLFLAGYTDAALPGQTTAGMDDIFVARMVK